MRTMTRDEIQHQLRGGGGLEQLAADLLEDDASLAERLRAAEGERDAALDALASCRKALEFIRTCAHYPIWVFRAQHWGLHERPDGYVQPHEVFCGLLSAAAQVPAEHLTGEEGEA